MIPGCRRLALVLAVLLGFTASAAAQTQPAPFYTLPAVGTWAEYDWQAVTADGKKQSGRLRLSCVGLRAVAGVEHFWVEVAREDRQGERVARQVRKLLVSVQAFAHGRSLRDSVAAAYDRVGPAGAVTKLSGKRLADFLALGFASPAPALKERSASETVNSKLGSFPARHVTAEGKVGSRTLVYHGWLTDRVPFGCVRVEMRAPEGGTVFRATLVRTGKDATSEVDESAAK